MAEDLAGRAARAATLADASVAPDAIVLPAPDAGTSAGADRASPDVERTEVKGGCSTVSPSDSALWAVLMVAALALITVEQAGAEPPSGHGGEFPGEIIGVA